MLEERKHTRSQIFVEAMHSKHWSTSINSILLHDEAKKTRAIKFFCQKTKKRKKEGAGEIEAARKT